MRKEYNTGGCARPVPQPQSARLSAISMVATIRNLNGRNSPSWGDCFLSIDLTSDRTSAAGGCPRFVPSWGDCFLSVDLSPDIISATGACHANNWLLFPVQLATLPKKPAMLTQARIAGFFHLIQRGAELLRAPPGAYSVMVTGSISWPLNCSRSMHSTRWPGSLSPMMRR